MIRTLEVLCAAGIFVGGVDLIAHACDRRAKRARAAARRPIADRYWTPGGAR